MLIVMRKEASEEEIQNIISYLRNKNLKAEKLPGEQRVAIGVTGNKQYVGHEEVQRMPGVAEVIHVTNKYKRVGREFIPEDTLVTVGEAVFGGNEAVVIAGPCSVESEGQVVETAHLVKEQGAKVLRGGIFKPRTSPYAFQGLGFAGLKFLQKARNETGLPICVEITSTEDVDVFKHEVDIIQIGARNMQNYELLKKVSKTNKAVLLKRSPSANVEEFLLAAEYFLDGGNNNVILCERGIRTYEQSTRYTLDLNSVALIKKLTHLPIIVDPSHAAGRHDLIEPLSRAALAAGADGLIIEVHPEPLKALSDQNQQLDFNDFKTLMKNIKPLINKVQYDYSVSH